uniref:Uncharacterized protein n=1 Tax=Panagrolaimus sp. PS1159 TaxID=55785 RepID=A0AC35ESJ7_9BILA
MKFGGISSICVLIIFISFPLFDAFVTCPYGRTDLILKGEKGETNCTTSCAVYSCVGKVNNGSFELHDVGCTEDFFRDCAFFHSAIDFVNATSPYEMNYYNGNVTYVSGCSAEKNGHDCILNKSANFVKEIAEKRTKGSLKDGEILTDVKDVAKNVTDPATSSTNLYPASATDASSVFVPEITSEKPMVFIPVLNNTSADPLVGPVNLGDNTINPVIIQKNSTVAPRTTSKTSTLSTARSSRRPVPTVAPTSEPVDDSTTVEADLKKDATTVTSDPVPAPSSDTTTPAGAPGGKSASNGQDNGFWKKIGCFAIGLILAAWIY